MKTVLTVCTIFMLFNLVSCGQKKVSESFKTFNEGVSLNLKSIDEQKRGNFDKASELNKLSIEKFREVLKHDSTHSLVRSALGHSLYIDKQFQDAIFWFEESNKLNGEQVQNYRELGLCKINLGQIKSGKADLDKAFSMDKSKDIKEITLSDLTDIGTLAFEYGEGYANDGELEKGRSYKQFSISVLMLAFDYDNSRKEIALKISDFADKIDDQEISKKYKVLADK